MLDTLTSENYRDFSARYANTFGWLVDGKRQFVHVLRVADERVYFTNATGMEYHAKMDHGVNFEFIPVDRGWFNDINGNPWLLSRVPARQWKRGISETNTMMYDGHSLRTFHVNYERLSKVFSDKFTELNYSKEIKPTGAWSKHFAVTKHGLHFYDQLIGSYNPKTQEIVLTSDIVKQELTDLINRNGWSVKITQTQEA